MSNSLGETPVFEEFSGEKLDDIKELVQEIELSKGDVLFEQDDPGDFLYIINDGLLKISRHDPISERRKTLAILGAGEIVGEMAVLTEENRSGEARALRDTHLFQIYEDDYLELLNKYPQMGVKLVRILSKRLLMSDEEIQSVTFNSIPGRLASQILKIANQFGTETDEGLKIDIGLTHQHLADLVGTNRETVTKHLNQFKRKGSITMENRTITVIDQESLEGWM